MSNLSVAVKEMQCEECLDSCHPDDSKENFFSWQQTAMCQQCATNQYDDYNSDLGALFI